VSIRIGPFTSNHVYRGNAAYSWISPDSAIARSSLRGVIVVFFVSHVIMPLTHYYEVNYDQSSLPSPSRESTNHHWSLCLASFSSRSYCI